MKANRIAGRCDSRYDPLRSKANDGRLYVISGDRLPDFIQTCAGNGHQGEHLAQILLNPNQKTRSVVISDPRPWPAFRDVVNLAVGFSSIILLRFTLSLFGLDESMIRK